MKITVAHSPDSDDAFMFYALASGRVRADGLEFEHLLCDIETLNRAAFEGTYEVSAVSFHAYAHLTAKYLLLPHGDAHEIGAGIGGKPIPGEDALPDLWAGRVSLANFGGGGEKTGLICGYLACDGELLKPVIAGLPRVVRVNIRTDPSGEWLDNMLQHAVTQAAAASPGSEVIIAHLAEVLFTEVLRRYLLALPEGRTGWLAGARSGALRPPLRGLPWRARARGRPGGGSFRAADDEPDDRQLSSSRIDG